MLGWVGLPVLLCLICLPLWFLPLWFFPLTFMVPVMAGLVHRSPGIAYLCLVTFAILAIPALMVCFESMVEHMVSIEPGPDRPVAFRSIAALKPSILIADATYSVVSGRGDPQIT